MFDLIRNHQLNIMLGLCSICFMMAVLLAFTRFLPKRRKWILIGMETVATLLLFFDRMAYIYSGNTSVTGYFMVRLANFMVFSLTAAVVYVFNLYLVDLITTANSGIKIPLRLRIVGIGALCESILVVISQFTGLYYGFDQNNVYHRGPGFIVCYLIPILGPVIQYTVIHQYRKLFSRLIYISLVLYIFVPIIVGIVQIFAYGISIVNMAMVLVSVSLYIFTYLDINDEVVKAHEIEISNLQQERKSMKRLFDQTAAAFVSAVEKKDVLAQGHSQRVADWSRIIASGMGKDDEESEEIYYTALLHDIGMVALPDSVVENSDELSPEEYELVKEKPLLSADILSSITEYPFLAAGAKYCYEKYDGSGYPEGLKGEQIPEASRIIAVADAYDSMNSKKRYRDPLPYMTIREEFVKKAGIQFDPEISETLIQILDREENFTHNHEGRVEEEITCKEYRESVSLGIPILQNITKITFKCKNEGNENGQFSAPALILFDSYDRHVHDNIKSISAFHYFEYGEVWFDGHSISTNTRNIKSETEEVESGNDDEYSIASSRYRDHVKLELKSPGKKVSVIIALPDETKEACIGITGENCHITDIEVIKTDYIVGENDISRIANRISYIERMESDVPNIQIDGNRTGATKGIPVEDGLRISFHTMSLPSANLIWHCPYIILFYSDDTEVGGRGYKEYALIKINGESTGDEDCGSNKLFMLKNEDFEGWDFWKEKNKKGYESNLEIIRRGDKITVITENLGIAIENTTTILDGNKSVYIALTGDQVALTDIRIY